MLRGAAWRNLSAVPHANSAQMCALLLPPFSAWGFDNLITKVWSSSLLPRWLQACGSLQSPAVNMPELWAKSAYGVGEGSRGCEQSRKWDSIFKLNCRLLNISKVTSWRDYASIKSLWQIKTVCSLKSTYAFCARKSNYQRSPCVPFDQIAFWSFLKKHWERTRYKKQISSFPHSLYFLYTGITKLLHVFMNYMAMER